MIPSNLKNKQSGEEMLREKNRRIIKYVIGNKYFYILTNLLDQNQYPLEMLVQTYHERWEIEEYFSILSQFIKKNMKLEHMKLKKESSIRRSINIQFLMSSIVYFIQNLYADRCKSKKYVINKSMIVEGIFNSPFLLNFIYNNDIEKTIDIFERNYIKITHTQKGKSYPIKCINPIYKSYLKYNKNKYKCASNIVDDMVT